MEYVNKKISTDTVPTTYTYTTYCNPLCEK